jgi:homoserine O-acetyltransferase
MTQKQPRQAFFRAARLIAAGCLALLCSPALPFLGVGTRGTIAFAFTEPHTRSTQVYINLVDNTRLDDQGFLPFGRVVAGMDVVEALYSGYGEDSGGGVRAGLQDSLIFQGNAYLDRAFPNLDRIVRTTVEL